jgi:hypothetical protein
LDDGLFRPTNRLRDQIRERREDDSYELGFIEVELIPDLTLEQVLATDITYTDLHRLFGYDKFAWTGPDVYICHVQIYLRGNYPHVFGLSNHQDRDLYVCAETATATAATTATCDFLVRLLATSKVKEAYIGGDCGSSPPISGPAHPISIFSGEPRKSSKSYLWRNCLE